MIRDINGSAQFPISQQDNVVYDYLHQNAAKLSSQEIIKKFKNLLEQGRNENTQVSKAMEQMLSVPPKSFYNFLNNCFYMIVDSWIESSASEFLLAELLDIFAQASENKSYNRRRKQLVNLINSYLVSPQFFQLKVIAAIIAPPHNYASCSLINSLVTNESIGGTGSESSKILENFFIRYPYLYAYYLPSDIPAINLVELIGKLQNQRQRDFEIQLSKHIIYRFRLKQLARMKLMAKGAGKIITKVENPSLLSEKAFKAALKQYLGKVDNQSSLLDESQRFIAENEYRTSYWKFKRDLGRFLCKNIKPRNNTYQLSSRLEHKLDEIFAHSNDKPFNRTLILQTCRQIFSFLIIDPNQPNHSGKFSELVANLGTAQVMMILVKITLICPESRADLEKKIYGILLNHQFSSIQEVPWLLKTLEHLLIAISIFFGEVDVSIARSALAH